MVYLRAAAVGGGDRHSGVRVACLRRCPTFEDTREESRSRLFQWTRVTTDRDPPRRRCRPREAALRRATTVRWLSGDAGVPPPPHWLEIYARRGCRVADRLITTARAFRVPVCRFDCDDKAEEETAVLARYDADLPPDETAPRTLSVPLIFLRFGSRVTRARRRKDLPPPPPPRLFLSLSENLEDLFRARVCTPPARPPIAKTTTPGNVGATFFSPCSSFASGGTPRSPVSQPRFAACPKQPHQIPWSASETPAYPVYRRLFCDERDLFRPLATTS